MSALLGGVWILASLSAASIVSAAAAPLIGETVPPLQAQVRWLKGEPVDRFVEGRVYVLELWATWCPPCYPMMEHLSEIAAKHRDRVSVVGVAVGTHVGLAPEAVVASRGERMRYAVGEEMAHGRVALRYAGDEDVGVPFVMIIDAQGRLAWRNDPGNPRAGFDETLARILAGTYDLEAASSNDRRRFKLRARADQLLADAQGLKAKGDHEGVTRVLQGIAELDGRMFGDHAVHAFQQLLCQGDERKAYRYGRTLVEGLLRDNVDALVDLERTIVGLPGVEHRDLELALAAVDRAQGLRGGEDPDFFFESAKVWFAAGDTSRAQQFQTRAVDAARRSGWDANYIEFVRNSRALDVSLRNDARGLAHVCK